MRRVKVFSDKRSAVQELARYVIEWCEEHPGDSLGGATGRSPIGLWNAIFEMLPTLRPAARDALLSQHVTFLDEYFGGYAAYWNWAWNWLRIDREGFRADQVYVPRGAFFENHRLVTSERLEELLSDWPDDWQALTEPGEDGLNPEIRIGPSPEHPVLAEIREALDEYDAIVRDHCRRLQLLGIGVGGSIESDLGAGGHLAFLESGSAARETGTSLVRLAASTQSANEPDFVLTSEDGPVNLQPARHAVSQGISSLLDHTGELLLMAWGETKRLPVQRLFHGTPGPLNPAAWVQEHDNVLIALDAAAYGTLSADELEEKGWRVEFEDQPSATMHM